MLFKPLTLLPVEDNAYSLSYLTSTHKAGVQGDAVSLPEREVSSPNACFDQGCRGTQSPCRSARCPRKILFSFILCCRRRHKMKTNKVVIVTKEKCNVTNPHRTHLARSRRPPHPLLRSRSERLTRNPPARWEAWTPPPSPGEPESVPSLRTTGSLPPTCRATARATNPPSSTPWTTTPVSSITSWMPCTWTKPASSGCRWAAASPSATARRGWPCPDRKGTPLN